MKSIIRIQRLKKKIQDINQFIKRIQDSCPHENVNIQHHGDTGNYDPTQDEYWTNFHCLDCDKTWTKSGTHFKAIK